MVRGVCMCVGWGGRDGNGTCDPEGEKKVSYSTWMLKPRR